MRLPRANIDWPTVRQNNSASRNSRYCTKQRRDRGTAEHQADDNRRRPKDQRTKCSPESCCGFSPTVPQNGIRHLEHPFLMSQAVHTEKAVVFSRTLEPLKSLSEDQIASPWEEVHWKRLVRLQLHQ